MKKFFMLFALVGGILNANAVENGDIVVLTPNVNGRVLYAAGGSNRVEVYANPESKPSGFLEINNSYFIDGESYIVDRIADHGFEFCDALTGMQTGPDCWLIGKNAFNGCTKLKKFTEYTPGSIESIEEYGFGYARALESINLPGVTSIGNFAFMTAGLNEAIFPKVKTIGVGAFQECAKLSSFSGGEYLESIGNIAFINCPALTGITLGPDLKSIGTTAFGFDTDLESVVIPMGLEKIDRDAFQGIGAETVYVLSERFMDFCDLSKILRNKTITHLYCLPKLEFEINYYLSVGSETNPAETLTSAKAVSLAEIIDIENVPDSDTFKILPKNSDITDIHVYSLSSGLELPLEGESFTSSDKSIRLSYLIGKDLLVYDWDLNRSTSGISHIDDTDLKTPAEWYTLDGIRVNPASLSPGLYLRHQNGKATKVLIR